jgi:2-polyprenyl-6-methoxyphenol hydroxylase-like FAD-dependent oxidoreductase
MKGCSVAVIGGGPAGTLCAAHFAKRGARVTVYEPRTVAQQTSVQLGWSIAMGRMGTDAIDAAGLSSDFGPTYRCSTYSLTQTISTETCLVTQIVL